MLEISFQNLNRLTPDDQEFLTRVAEKISSLAEGLQSLFDDLSVAAVDGDMTDPQEIQIAANNVEVALEMLTNATVERVSAGFGLD
jgi:hypothetical protein